MKTSKLVENVMKPNDNTKLASLLALATGAIALPQTSSAGIIYTNLASPVTVGYAGGGDASFLFDLPGGNATQFGFARTYGTAYVGSASLTYLYRTVLVGDLGGTAPAAVRVNSNGFVAPIPAGATWSQGGVASFAVGAAGTAYVGFFDTGVTPQTGYDHQYLAWAFTDVTSGNAVRYGWTEISLAVANYAGGGPSVTIWGYGYDDSGLKPTMGQGAVPEPSTAALTVFGAMALGARGLRRWRQQRGAAPTA